MKTLLMTFNAKYIHTNLALRLLKANTKHPVDILEFTIKEDLMDAINKAKDYAIVGLSVYIWNVDITTSFVSRLKEMYPHIVLILGGPEVSYDALTHLRYADYVIKGEGEVAFDALLTALHDKTSLASVPHLSAQGINNPITELDLTQVKLAYKEDNDHLNRITYIETSRGCPYLCSYCMASLEKKVRYFDIEQIKNELLVLIQKGATTFKFLDRTFNTNVKRTLDFFHFLYALPFNDLSFQFEITGDLLKQSIIDDINAHAPHHLIRFEIGIQSTNYETNLLVRRIQNNDVLFQNIRAIQNGQKIDLHLDLIAGLPREDLTSFKKTFNDVIALRPKELQLGFLKCLKGTQLYLDAPLYNYRFDSNAPYEIIDNDALSVEDKSVIKSVEYVLNVFYNKPFFPVFMARLLDMHDSAFDLFTTLYQLHHKKTHYQLIDLASTLDAYASVHAPHLREVLLLDYLNYHHTKPRLYLPILDKSSRNACLRAWHHTHLSSYKLDELYKYSVITTLGDTHFVALYQEHHKEIVRIKT